jgi:hypothetical protein
MRVNDYGSIATFNETFTRDCQFYKSGENYQSKMCKFIVKEWGRDGKTTTVAEKELDMSPYVNKLNEKVKIKFENSIYPDTELLISISVSDPEALRKNAL